MKSISYKYGTELELDLKVLNRDDKELAKKFRCNNTFIDSYIKKHCWKDKETVTYAAIDLKEDLIVSILTITCSGIYNEPSVLSRRKCIMTPAVEIKDFGVDYRYQKLPFSGREEDKTLSYQLFNKWIANIIEITDKKIGARKIILYSVPRAKNFYIRYGFRDYKKHMKRDEKLEYRGCFPMYFNLDK